MHGAKQTFYGLDGPRLLGALQCPFDQFATHKGAGERRLAGVRPGENFRLLVLGALQAAQRACHGDDMHQADALFELGVEHDSAGHMAYGPVSRFFEDGQQAGEMQQDPHDHAAPRQGNARPAKLSPGTHGENDDGHRGDDFGEVHGVFQNTCRDDNEQLPWRTEGQGMADNCRFLTR